MDAERANAERYGNLAANFYVSGTTRAAHCAPEHVVTSFMRCPQESSLYPHLKAMGIQLGTEAASLGDFETSTHRYLQNYAAAFDQQIGTYSGAEIVEVANGEFGMGIPAGATAALGGNTVLSELAEDSPERALVIELIQGVKGQAWADIHTEHATRARQSLQERIAALIAGQ